MGFFIYSNTFAIIEFDIHETIFIFWQSKYILQKYYLSEGYKFMHVSYMYLNKEFSIVSSSKKINEFNYLVYILHLLVICRDIQMFKITFGKAD